MPAPGASGLKGAAFFDLDKTLIEGSSGVYFARAAYRSGLINRRQLLVDLWANVKFRLRGATDQRGSCRLSTSTSVVVGR